MKEQTFTNFMLMVAAQVDHCITHFEEIRQRDGYKSAVDHLHEGVATSTLLSDIAKNFGAVRETSDVLVEACWPIVGMALDIAMTGTEIVETPSGDFEFVDHPELAVKLTPEEQEYFKQFIS